MSDRRSWWQGAAGAVAGLSGLAALRFGELHVHGFLPPCPFHALTGLYCPGCGSTRAMGALMRGDFLAAWHFNPLFLLSLPTIAAILTSERYSARPLSHSPRFAWGCFVAIVLFGIARNVPPFAALAPH